MTKAQLQADNDRLAALVDSLFAMLRAQAQDAEHRVEQAKYFMDLKELP